MALVHWKKYNIKRISHPPLEEWLQVTFNLDD